MKTHRYKASLALLALSSLMLSGCGSGGDGGTDGSDQSDASACAPSDGKVTLTYTSWIPNIGEVIEVWNEQHPDIQVDVQTGPSGNAGTYQNFFNQLKAGNAPDLGQIEYDALPNFRVQDGLMNIAACEAVVKAESEFIDWTWNQVTLGGDDGVYAIPQDTGPMALYYRSDLFKANGIEVPSTWEEFAEAAVEVKEAGGHITNFSPTDVNWFAGLVWQADGQWFEVTDDQWNVNLTGAKSKQVAEYWQQLVEKDLVTTHPGFTEEWNNAYNSGEVWAWPSAVWGANSLISGAPDTAGKWSVVKMPQWEEGAVSAGNWGGSSTAVFKGSEHPYEATKFALWLNTSEEALTLLNKKANLYPATVEGLELPVLSEGVEFYGGQPIYDVFAKAAKNVEPDFVFGPTMTQTYADVSDGFGQAVSGKGTLFEALTRGERLTVQALQAQSIPVAGD
ncbi:MAG TPA: extracellular solute-binding protein [Arthrobacter sp.]|nr:extracellular solute-binding protein [Arthrobacter sp.]